MSVINYQKSHRDIYQNYLPCSFICGLCLNLTGNEKSSLNSSIHCNAISIALPQRK